MALSFTLCVPREFTVGRLALRANHGASKWSFSCYRKLLSKRDFEPANAAVRALPKYMIRAPKLWLAFAAALIPGSELNRKTIARQN
jgi:hypothetical protein